MYVVAVTISILTLLIVNLIIGVLSYNKALTQMDVEEAINNVIFVE